MPRFDGPDCSHYQPDAGPVDLATTRATPTWFIGWKRSQGLTKVDTSFDVHAPEIEAQGFTHKLAYHWIESLPDPIAQAQHYLAVMGNRIHTWGSMLDAEERILESVNCIKWCETVEAVTHRPVVIYSGLYVNNGTIWKSDALRQSAYGPRPYIVAAYTTEVRLALLMVSTGSQNYPYQGWQYSSDGPVPGITGRCDMNQIDRAAFDLACGYHHEQPQPVPHGYQQGDFMDVVSEEDGVFWRIYTDGNGALVATPFSELPRQGDNSTFGKIRDKVNGPLVPVPHQWLQDMYDVQGKPGPGPKGDKGDQGDPGPKGDQGEPGTTGIINLKHHHEPGPAIPDA